jgi:hypothetical protein
MIIDIVEIQLNVEKLIQETGSSFDIAVHQILNEIKEQVVGKEIKIMNSNCNYALAFIVGHEMFHRFSVIIVENNNEVLVHYCR